VVDVEDGVGGQRAEHNFQSLRVQTGDGDRNPRGYRRDFQFCLGNIYNDCLGHVHIDRDKHLDADKHDHRNVVWYIHIDIHEHKQHNVVNFRVRHGISYSKRLGLGNCYGYFDRNEYQYGYFDRNCHVYPDRNEHFHDERKRHGYGNCYGVK
jgi:hypothetical protein